MYERYAALFDGESMPMLTAPCDTPEQAIAAAAEFVESGLTCIGVARILTRTELCRLAAAKRLRAALAALPEPPAIMRRARVGIVFDWKSGYDAGWIADLDGGGWRVPAFHLVEAAERLEVNTVVTFSGSGKPAPGYRWPQAYTVRVLIEPDQVRAAQPRRRLWRDAAGGRWIDVGADHIQLVEHDGGPVRYGYPVPRAVVERDSGPLTELDLDRRFSLAEVEDEFNEPHP